MFLTNCLNRSCNICFSLAYLQRTTSMSRPFYFDLQWQLFHCHATLQSNDKFRLPFVGIHLDRIVIRPSARNSRRIRSFWICRVHMLRFLSRLSFCLSDHWHFIADRKREWERRYTEISRSTCVHCEAIAWLSRDKNCECSILITSDLNHNEATASPNRQRRDAY